MHPRHVRRVAVTALVAVTPLVQAIPAAAAPSQGQEEADTTTTALEVVDQEMDHSIIPTPQPSGSKEIRPGEPGSKEQYLAFALIVAGLAAIAGLVSRESRRKRAALGIPERDPAELVDED